MSVPRTQKLNRKQRLEWRLDVFICRPLWFCALMWSVVTLEVGRFLPSPSVVAWSVASQREDPSAYLDPTFPPQDLEMTPPSPAAPSTARRCSEAVSRVDLRRSDSELPPQGEGPWSWCSTCLCWTPPSTHQQSPVKPSAQAVRQTLGSALEQTLCVQGPLLG